jgi:membrane protein DedA with SNARE-associated domain
MLESWFTSLGTWYLQTLEQGGLPLVALLMAIESSIVPLPSEIVIPPAAHLAWTSSALSVLGVPLSGWPAQIGLVLAGAVGSWVGATAMYWAARLGGRPLILRYGKYVLIPPEKVAGAERWAAHYGAMGIFVSRLLPVVRHLIGIPAGIVRMAYLPFSIYTLLGSAVWSAVLCWIGVEMGADLARTTNLTHTLSKWLGLAVLVLGGLYYFFVHRQMKAEPASASNDTDTGSASA